MTRKLFHRKFLKLLWTDESKFTPFGTTIRIFPHRLSAGRVREQCIVHIVKHGRGNMISSEIFNREAVGDVVKIEAIIWEKEYLRIL